MIKIFKGIFYFFDRLEDVIRESLSRHPFIYTFIGGTGVVLFWRGVWRSADVLESSGGIFSFLFSSSGSIFLGVILLLSTGLFVSVFIGDSIIISGLKKDKKVIDKTIEKVISLKEEEEEEETEVQKTLKLVTEIKKEVESLEEEIKHNK